MWYYPNYSTIHNTAIYYTKVAIKYSWQGRIMYSGYYGSALTIQLFIIQLFTIQRLLQNTPGRVYSCIVLYVVLSQLFNNLLYHYLLLIKCSWQGYIMYSGYCILVLTIPLFTVQEYVIQKCVIFHSWQGYTI